ncbi:teichoic acid transport system ATP-binding protein [Pullulanibacillus pueri]|uniref:Teichoic acids export ATP-binding protein TagH n=1 Tax=Pullulanibacillus pueri TaxID=1437324 RepID=A0A8J2ZTJ1_9BACL|nr:teichoic acids export ABC transporter ATP-binding subunit TagH [Pullulanibacillus pueri]MBM7683629.1 teichoic acid transport system ATP-binding protein [Pullulanibacillus pueri]GGH76616.1 hypothetical protein GCM10007096_07310 [Pullulanibacillus pueri]
MTSSVVVKNVTKRYKLYGKNSEKIIDVFTGNQGEEFLALKDVSFTAEKGDVIGIIGVNGSGKSTLSNIISGVIPPTEGTVKSKGKTALIAIASGLNNELTGRENIELKCLMLGFSKKEIRELEPEIIEFAEIGKFIDQPVKSYSSGMKSRLGFAISVTVDPDILVIDEALSVGDQAFAEKCLDKMNSFKEQGKTIFFISHSIGQVKQFCDKALWLENGTVRDFGLIEEIVPKYQQFLKEYKMMTAEEKKAFQQGRLGNKSNVKQQESENGKVTESGAEYSTDKDVENIPLRTKERQKKRKNKRGKKSLLIIIVCLLILIIGGILFNLNNGSFDSLKSIFNQSSKGDSSKGLSSDNKANNKKQETKAQPTQAEIQVAEDKNVEMVVVNKSLVNLRSKPQLTSNIVGSASLGDAFTILKKQADANEEDVTWFNITLSDGSKAWISSSVVKKVNSYNHEVETMPSGLNALLQERKLPTTLEELSTLFDSPFDEIRNDYADQVINQSESDQVETLKLQSASLVGEKNSLKEIVLSSINQDYDLKAWNEELGNPVLQNQSNPVSIYFINQMEIKIYIDANSQSINKISLSMIGN